ncbi:tape measure protein [Bacillus sp. JJ1503]|uniref:tape measure protein n=1 Tax=Bacillus sp. JJ1503 TaxID=3122956 RepID=UPI002FFEF1E7
MATIRTVVQVQDNMSRAFQSMNNAMNIVINSFEQLQMQSSNAVDTASIQAARQQLALAENSFNQIEQQIHQANNQQQQLNNSINQGSSAASGFLSKLVAIVGTYLSLQAGKSIIELSDQMTNITARLKMVNDGLQTTAELQQMIFDSAQRSYGSYADTADLVGKLSMNAKDAFGSNREAIAFAELLNKQYSIAGTNADGVKNATIQLTQALGSGVLRGQELNSIFQHAPNIIQNIADYLEIPIGKIRELSADGKLSADVIKQAMFAAADQINKDFASMPLTFEQIWTSFKNEALWAFQPVLQKLNEIANNEKFQSVINSTVNSLHILSNIALSTLSVLMSIGGFVYDTWSYAEPAIVAATIALVAYGIALLWINRQQIIAAALTATATIRKWAYVAATIVSTAATYGLTAAMAALSVAIAANPIAWLIGAIVVLILIVYGAVAAVNHFAGTSYSATGIIAGAFAVLGAFIWNTVVGVINAIIQILWTNFAEPWIGIIEWVLNVFNGGFNSFGDAVANLLGQIISWFLSLGKVVTNIIDSIFGTNWTAGLSSLQDSVLAWGKNDSAITLSRNAPAIKSRIEYSGAWDAGYNWGSNLFSGDKNNPTSTMKDALSGLEGIKSAVNETGKETAGNTKKMADSMEMAEEDLKYLRDLAERDVINRFTTAEVKVDMTNHNTVNSDLDLDGIIDRFGEKLEETLDVIAEGAD